MADDEALLAFIHAIAAGDESSFAAQLAASPALAHAILGRGATRASAAQYYLADIGHYMYAGDSALHIAAAAHRPAMARALIAAGSAVAAVNRRGAGALHYAADGAPGFPAWNADRQAETIASLIAAGADPNAIDKSGVAPLHRAVRTRCAAAVRALLDGGADVRRPNGNGSTPMQLARQQTGRGGSGLAEAKDQQAEIIRLLERYAPSHAG